MKQAVRDIVGRTIQAVVVSEDNRAGPRDQIFLIFTDGTCYEFYGDVRGSGNVVLGDRRWAVQYAENFRGRVSVFDMRRAEPPVEPPTLRDEGGIGSDAISLEPFDGPSDGDAWSPSGTVLVVDDDSRVRESYRKILERTGFSVVDAPDGFSGFNVFAECRDELVAVILDFRMPRMNGDKALKMMRRVDPSVPIIVASYLPWDDGIDEMFPDDEVAGYMQLPVSESELIGTLRKVVTA